MSHIRRLKRRDDRSSQFRELIAVLPAGEQVNVSAWAGFHAVRLDRVTASQREPVPGAGREGHLRYPLVPWLHPGL